jgi:hypothetical protein
LEFISCTGGWFCGGIAGLGPGRARMDANSRS